MSDEFDPIELSSSQLPSQIEHLLTIGQVERARQLAMQAIASDPQASQGHLMLALVLLNDEQPVEALAATEAALQVEPDDDMAHRLRSVALLALGRFAASEEAVRRAMLLEPGDGRHAAHYARLLSLLDRDQAALDAAAYAIEQDPDDAYLHQLRAELLLHVHPRHWRISEEAVRTALRIDPQDADSHAVLGHVLILAGRRGEAEDAFRTSLRLAPGNALAIQGLSHIVKGTHWWYRPMLAWNELLMRQGRDGQLAIVFGLWVVYATVASVLPEAWEGYRPFLNYGYMGLVAYTYFAEPITRALLRSAYPWLE